MSRGVSGAAGGVSCGSGVGVLFVCLGNICRSPTAEGVMRGLLAKEGLHELAFLDSAGTGAWHVGESPDRRATQAARARGYALTGAARQVRLADFDEFDLILAMDSSNARDLRRLAPHEDGVAKVRLLREFDPDSVDPLDVPDPYYGGERGFEEVLDLVEAACAGVIDHLRGFAAASAAPQLPAAPEASTEPADSAAPGTSAASQVPAAPGTSAASQVPAAPGTSAE